MFKILLINPRIPQNTGNIARTCVSNDLELHLAGEIGFSLEDKYLKRAGLDYMKHLKLFVHKSFDLYLEFERNRNSDLELYFFTKYADTSFFEKKYKKGVTLVFGAEDTGIPKEILIANENYHVKIPMLSVNARSLNLSNCVCVAVYEVIRQIT